MADYLSWLEEWLAVGVVQVLVVLFGLGLLLRYVHIEWDRYQGRKHRREQHRSQQAAAGDTARQLERLGSGLGIMKEDLTLVVSSLRAQVDRTADQGAGLAEAIGWSERVDEDADGNSHDGDESRLGKLLLHEIWPERLDREEGRLQELEAEHKRLVADLARLHPETQAGLQAELTLRYFDLARQTQEAAHSVAHLRAIRDALASAVTNFDDRAQYVIYSRYFEGLSIEDIGRRVNLPISDVEMILLLCVDKLESHVVTELGSPQG